MTEYKSLKVSQATYDKLQGAKIELIQLGMYNRVPFASDIVSDALDALLHEQRAQSEKEERQ